MSDTTIFPDEHVLWFLKRMYPEAPLEKLPEGAISAIAKVASEATERGYDFGSAMIYAYELFIETWREWSGAK